MTAQQRKASAAKQPAPQEPEAPASAPDTEPSTVDAPDVVEPGRPPVETEPAPGEPPAAPDEPAGRRECVVPADFHVGAATPGSKVCSYHAMHYDRNGKRRGGEQA